MEITNEQLANFATKEDVKDLKHEIDMMSANLSRQIAYEVTNTFWKIIPLMIGLMTLVNGVFFIAYKMS